MTPTEPKGVQQGVLFLWRYVRMILVYVFILLATRPKR